MDRPEIKEIYQNYPLSLLLEADPDIKKLKISEQRALLRGF